MSKLLQDYSNVTFHDCSTHLRLLQGCVRNSFKGSFYTTDYLKTPSRQFKTTSRLSKNYFSQLQNDFQDSFKNHFKLTYFFIFSIFSIKQKNLFSNLEFIRNGQLLLQTCRPYSTLVGQCGRRYISRRRKWSLTSSLVSLHSSSRCIRRPYQDQTVTYVNLQICIIPRN